MRFKQLLWVSVAAGALVACSEPEPRYTPAQNNKSQPVSTTDTQAAPEVIADASTPVNSSARVVSAPLSIGTASSAQFVTVNGRPMVMSANINFETKNVQATTLLLGELAQKYGGFVSSSSIINYPQETQAHPKPDSNTLIVSRYKHEGKMTLRVPRDKSNEFIKEMQQVIVFLERQDTQLDDISFSLRKQVLEAQRQQEMLNKLNALQRTQQGRQAPVTEESIRAEFEAKARENEAILQHEYWQDKIAYATITLLFRQPEGVVSELIPNLDTVAKQHRPNVGMMAWNNIKQGWDYILMSLIFLLGYWPITLGLPAVWLGMKIARKVRARRLTRKLTEAVKTSRRYQYPDEVDDFD